LKSADFRGWVLFGAAALWHRIIGVVATLGGSHMPASPSKNANYR